MRPDTPFAPHIVARLQPRCNRPRSAYHPINTSSKGTRGVSMRNKTKLLAPLTAVSVAALAVSGALAAADGATAGGPVQLYEADTELAGSLGTVILTGAITDHGHDHQGVDPTGTINKLVLSKG